MRMNFKGVSTGDKFLLNIIRVFVLNGRKPYNPMSILNFICWVFFCRKKEIEIMFCEQNHLRSAVFEMDRRDAECLNKAFDLKNLHPRLYHDSRDNRIYGAEYSYIFSYWDVNQMPKKRLTFKEFSNYA